MLRIIFGHVEGDLESIKYIWHPGYYFDRNKDDKWLANPLFARMVYETDESEFVEPACVKIHNMGIYPPQWLSNEMKALLLLYNIPDNVYHISMGDNLSKWLLEIGNLKDITINIGYLQDFSCCENFEILIVNTQKIVHNMRELIDEYFYIDDNLDYVTVENGMLKFGKRPKIE